MLIALLDLLYANHQRDTGMNCEQHSITAYTQPVAGFPHQRLDLLNMRPTAEGINRLGNVSLNSWRELPCLP
ncbi:MAG: hypothetical protein LBD42_09605 [Desulfovibrio sp.]|nr:hypothetical protein [Desulfovibrio sp.]